MNSEYTHCRQSRYIDNFRRYMKYFKREQLHVVDGDALIENPLPELRNIESFLGLKPKFNEVNIYFDKRKGFYCVRRQGRGKCLGASKGRTHPKVDSDVIQKLKDYFRPLNLEFYKAVGQNFTW